MKFDRRAILTVLLATGGSMLATGTRHSLSAQSTVQATANTLYQRLGGYDFITRFVDTAFPRVATNAQLSRLFRGHAKDSQMRQRQLIVDALCRAAGGPCLYIGRDLKLVHEGLAITDDDWRVFISIIQSTAQELRLAGDTQREFLKMFEGFRPVVVVKL